MKIISRSISIKSPVKYKIGKKTKQKKEWSKIWRIRGRVETERGGKAEGEYGREEREWKESVIRIDVKQKRKTTKRRKEIAKRKRECERKRQRARW